MGVFIHSYTRLEGFEPPACGFEARRSIHLSYRRKQNLKVSQFLPIWLN